MDIFKSQPEFANQISKAKFIILPVAVEFLSTILTALEYNPAASVRLLIAVNLKVYDPGYETL